MESANIEPKIGSEKAFAITFCVVFALLGWFDPFDSSLWLYTSFSLSVALLGLGLIAPSTLATPNRWWFRFGMFLGGIVAPITMGLIFLLVFVPTGLLMRIFKRDPLNLKTIPDSSSYWIHRDDPSIDMKKQF